MRMSEKKGIMTVGMLAVIGICCIALVSPVAAIYPADKWLTNNVTVNADNTTIYANINGVNFTDSFFFAVTGNGHYNQTAPAWNWTTDPQYYDRYYMEQLKVGRAWYPASVGSSDWEWVFINEFGINSTIYKKLLVDGSTTAAARTMPGTVTGLLLI